MNISLAFLLALFANSFSSNFASAIETSNNGNAVEVQQQLSGLGALEDSKDARLAQRTLQSMSSNCFKNHNSAGCDCPACEDAICYGEGKRPQCCTASWDGSCVHIALYYCDFFSCESNREPKLTTNAPVASPANNGSEKIPPAAPSPYVPPEMREGSDMSGSKRSSTTSTTSSVVFYGILGMIGSAAIVYLALGRWSSSNQPGGIRRTTPDYDPVEMLWNERTMKIHYVFNFFHQRWDAGNTAKWWSKRCGFES